MAADEMKLRVRYAETDQMGRAYYAWYLVWFEAGRTNFLRNAGLAYKDLEKRGVFLPVKRVAAHYERPVRYDDEITVRTRIKKFGPASVVFEAEVVTESGETACRGEVELAVTDAGGRVSRWPDDVAAVLAAAAGEEKA